VLELVVEPGQRLDEDVDALVAEFVPSGREKVQRLVLEKIEHCHFLIIFGSFLGEFKKKLDQNSNINLEPKQQSEKNDDKKL
jgi:hypothetical protein